MTDYYGLIQYMQKHTTQELEEKYQIPQKVQIDTLNHLEKLVNQKNKQLQSVQALHLYFDQLEDVQMLRLNQLLLQHSQHILQLKSVTDLTVELKNCQLNSKQICDLIAQIVRGVPQQRNLQKIRLDLRGLQSFKTKNAFTTLLATEMLEEANYFKLQSDTILAFRPDELSKKREGQLLTEVQAVVQECLASKSIKILILDLSNRGINNAKAYQQICEPLRRLQKLNYIGVKLNKSQLILPTGAIWNIIASLDATPQLLTGDAEKSPYCHVQADASAQFGTSASALFFNKDSFQLVGESTNVDFISMDNKLSDQRQLFYALSVIRCAASIPAANQSSQTIDANKISILFNVQMERSKLLELKSPLWSSYLRPLNDHLKSAKFSNIRLDYSLNNLTIKSPQMASKQLKLLIKEFQASQMSYFCLKLRRLIFEDQVIALFCEALSRTRVRYLLLRFEEVNLQDSAAERIFDALRNSHIEKLVLNVSKNLITNDGFVDCLQYLSTNRNWRDVYVNFEGNKISDEPVLKKLLHCLELLHNEQRLTMLLAHNNISLTTVDTVNAWLKRSGKNRKHTIRFIEDQ